MNVKGRSFLSARGRNFYQYSKNQLQIHMQRMLSPPTAKKQKLI
jgi:hypothetical protein